MRIGRCRRWRVVLWMVLALGSGVAAAQTCAEGQIATEATGFASVIGDVGAAMDEAERDALRTATGQATGVVLESSTVVVDQVLAEDYVRTSTSGFVASHSVLDRVVDEASVRVVVAACVDPRDLRADLEAFGAVLRTQLGNPRLAIVADGGDAGGGESARRLLEHHFAESGFDVRASVADGCESASDPLAFEVVICAVVDDAVATTSMDENLHTARATVDLRAIVASTSQVVARVSGDATGEISSDAGLAVGRAVEGAVAPLLDEFTRQVVQALNADAENTASVEVVVSNLPDFAAYGAVETFLRGARGVDGVEPRGFRDGTGTFSVRGAALASDLARRLQELPDLELRVTLVAANRVDVEVEP